MAFTFADYERYVRNTHPAFEPRVLPSKVLADFATLDQRDVLTTALLKDRQYLMQSMPIAFDTSRWDLDAPGTAGAGTPGGVPAEADGQGGYSYVQSTTGSAVELNTTNVVVLVNETVVASATSTTLTGLGVSWATNAYMGETVVIVAGRGTGQAPREIASNTSDTLTITESWAITPDATSVFQVVQSTTTVDRTFGVVTNLPSTTTHLGYVVKLNAQGIPYLDTTTPLVATLSNGVPLPPHQSIHAVTVWITGNASDGSPLRAPFELLSYHNRRNTRAAYSGYVMNGTLYLTGRRGDWSTVQNLELEYTPIPPAITARTDYFLLPDNALPYLVARGALFAANRLQGNDLIPAFDMTQFVAKESEAKRQFLGTIGLTTTARTFRMRAGRY